MARGVRTRHFSLAFEEAAIRGIGVLAVRVYHPAEPPWGLGELPYVEDAERAS